MTGMDALVDSLLGLASSWEDKADTFAAHGAVIAEQDYRTCARELRDVLAKHKVGNWG